LCGDGLVDRKMTPCHPSRSVYSHSLANHTLPPPLTITHSNQAFHLTCPIPTHQTLPSGFQAQAAGPDVVDALAPLLRSRVLRTIVQTLANPSPDVDLAMLGNGGGHDGASDVLGYWARNPRVLAVLHAAARALARGQVSERQLEALLLQQLQVRQFQGLSCSS
jgi:hypothetical protein